MITRVTSRKLLRVYVDETGDRGTSARSSPFFAFAAILVADENEAELRAAMAHLRTRLKTPSGAALNWNRHVKTFSRRQHVTSTLAALRQVSVVYVMVDKAAIPAGSGMLDDHVLFYNFAAGLVLERAVLAAHRWPGGHHEAIVRFGHVRGFDHGTSRDYFHRKRTTNATANLPWGCLKSIHFSDQASWDGLQAADQYAGMLHAAFHPDEFGGYESAHFLAIRHQLRRSPRGKAWGWGFKFLGDGAAATRLPWWPHTGL
ncbi:MAG: DUF3800 domain-containing protein [Actinophytocola sp.]|nr:DUF3800 domain-containing protein [Actinophytocola sp.]